MNAIGAYSQVDGSGMPGQDPAGPAQPNVNMADPDQSSDPPGFLSSIESFGMKAVQAAESGVKTVYGAGKTVVGDVVGGAEGVVHDVVGTATGAVTGVTMNIVLILGVVGIALVFIARSGAISVSR